MNTAAKILVSGMGLALAACGMSTAGDVDKTSRDRAVYVETARQDGRQTVDAANREPAESEEQGKARVADAHAAASREINETALKLSLKQAKADYHEAIAKADGDLSVAVEKCAVRPAGARTACEINARSMRDQSVEAAKVKLSLADQ